MERQYILHMFTPGRQISPFDVNMAVDAGYQVVVPYGEVGPDNVAAMTQDAIFSRGPKGCRYTGLFIGGRDVIVAAAMLDLARKAMVAPFAVAAFADPSGAYTTAAAMIACVERQMRTAHGTDLVNKRVLLLGGSGPVGRIVGVLAARLGASVVLASHRGIDRARGATDETNRRFDTDLRPVATDTAAALHEQLALSQVVCATAAAGAQVMNESALPAARALLVAADVNAVPPAGIAGVGVFDDGKILAGSASGAVAIGALAIGNVKYQTQHRLFLQMREASAPVYLGIEEALAVARQVLAQAE